MGQVLTRLFGFSGRVTRGTYLAVGLSLMALKYGVDALVYWFVVGGLWNPIDYLNPIYAERMAGAPPALELPHWYPIFLLLWGLLFAWIGTIWSARRAADASRSPWWSLFFFIPLCNYLLILVLVTLPTSRRELPSRAADERKLTGVLQAGVTLVVLCASLYGVMVQGTGTYGMAGFISLPFFFGAGLGYLQNRNELRWAGETIGLAFGSTALASTGLLLFAAEGVVCLVMAFPIVFAATLIGALIGRLLAQAGGAERTAPMCFVLCLPFSAWVEAQLEPLPPRAVTTVIEVDAPPEVVWEHVIAFSELPAPDGWLFETGIAYPKRARIEGSGVGAVRFCEFSTGAFIEPITTWDAPHRLAFDVTAQPIPMEEWSFYDNLRPPHLETAFRSVRGEFLLVPLENGRTRLEGTTWYTLEMAPIVYWQLWSDEIVHRIHGRVLRHVKALSEN